MPDPHPAMKTILSCSLGYRAKPERSMPQDLSVGFTGHLGATRTDEKIEIAALVGLRHMLDIDAIVADGGERGRPPFRQAPLNLLLLDQKIQATARHVNRNHVAF